jgi:hypothetical protein
VPRTVPVGTVPQVISDFLWSDGMTHFFPHKHLFYFISQSSIEFLSLNHSIAERRPNSLQLHTSQKMTKLELIFLSCIPPSLLPDYPLKHLGNFIKHDT